MKSGIRSRRHAEMLLAGVIAARATSYLFSKLIMEGMGCSIYWEYVFCWLSFFWLFCFFSGSE